MQADRVEVEQVDRDVTHDLLCSFGMTAMGQVIRAGNADDHRSVQIVARHRLSSRPAPCAPEPVRKHDAQREADAVQTLFRRYQEHGEFTVAADVVGCGRVKICVAPASAPKPEPAAGETVADALKLAEEYADKRDWNGAYHAMRIAFSHRSEEWRAGVDKVLIWSGEHHAYWRPNSAGYCTDGLGAGLYDRAKAERIVAGTDPEKKLELRPIPWDAPFLRALTEPEKGEGK